ncbi:MAG: methylenetetrahydrofolate--tRNA-(uracil(54)-C(5))-methyltransferase (FADH(2)-oxidizing) TrmFO [Acidobacteria bacterium]|nr:methylenetetrahydrofolate--tRNA-(uracil(54)-C(5))-methyltransferase (FADH(2)-oxidizing) TrmFO [Acidobacteriota bacterium]
MSESCIEIIGGGLAGCEAAYQLGKRGIAVRLYEMRPDRKTAVHQTDRLAELVCSNSFRSDERDHPVGLIKREMAAFDSLIVKAARASSIPAGGALAVDREAFSGHVMQALESLNAVSLIRQEVTEIPPGFSIIAAGPLCSDALAQSVHQQLGDTGLYFYDAIAPVIEYDSLDLEVVFAQSRYGKGEGSDYLNIPLSKAQYLELHRDLVTAERAEIKAHDSLKFFEGCLPVEVMADRGVDTLRFGPLKPVGLTDPRTDQQPYAVIQLRQDNYARSHWNLVGFQTQLKWGDQRRILQKLPGMANARFVRFGMIHRNTFVDSTKHLLPTFQLKNHPQCMLAGQISGVEGYIESASVGLMCGLNMARMIRGHAPVVFPSTTAMGSLAHYVTFQGHRELQPTNVNYGIFEPLPPGKKIKRSDRRRAYAIRALQDLLRFALASELDIDEPFLRTQLAELEPTAV